MSQFAWRVTTATCCAVLFLAQPATAQVAEHPGLQVDADLPPTIHQAESFQATFRLQNSGAVVFSDVVVTPTDACQPTADQGSLEFMEIQGDGDLELEPAEVWSYHAPDCVDQATSLAGLEVEAFDGIETLNAHYTFEYQPIPPIDVEELGEVTADSCLIRKFDVPFQIVSSSPLFVETATLELAVPAESGDLTIVDATDFAEIQSVPGNHDAIYDPGETWIAGFFFTTLADCPDKVIPEPPLVLLLSISGTSLDSGAMWCIGTEACPTPKLNVGTIVEILDGDSTDSAPGEGGPDQSLPFTGDASVPIGLFGALLLAIGGVLLGLNRDLDGSHPR